jgi:hypothetical protein
MGEWISLHHCNRQNNIQNQTTKFETDPNNITYFQTKLASEVFEVCIPFVYSNFIEVYFRT